MATLIFTALGTAVGGPIGGAIGAILGNQIDQQIFKPTTRQGPRLGDLTVQTSTYGAQIPKLFGRTRISGTVIWATDLIETKMHQSGGKGRGSTDVYSYSASFAVLLSARPVVGIGRIWADGKLLRGQAGDLKTQGVFRLHTGSEDQPADPLIASAEGAYAPAYRGSAYVVFEGLQLGDYGNRIPSLSFEVIADTAAIAVGTMIASLAADGVAAEAGPSITGFAATGATVRDVVDTLMPAFPMSCRAAATASISFAVSTPVLIDAADLGAGSGNSPHDRHEINIAPLETVAAAVTVAYFDTARDYQPGLQRARREGAGRREERIDLPVTIGASSAHAIAETVLAQRTGNRTTARFALPWRPLTLRPGDRVETANADWRINELRFEAMSLSLRVVRSTILTSVTPSAESGRPVSETDLQSGPTSVIAVDMPPTGDTPAIKPVVTVFANGASPGWRRADLLASIDGGVTYAVAGMTALPATLGTLATPLATGSAWLIDRANSFEVALLNPSQTLVSADTGSLLAGANAAMVGDEVIQFGTAVEVSSGRWRLSALWRGRRATEDAIVTHATGTRFVLLDPATAAALPDAMTRPGVIVLASGVGDASPYPTAQSITASRATMPLSPIRLLAERATSGDTTLRWTRRSRDGWLWRDGVDVPLAEEAERYRVTRFIGSTTIVDEVTGAVYIYTSAARAADLASGATSVVFKVAQVGATAVSPPATLSLQII